MVPGLQGQLGSPTSVLATAKHYLGDGGTFHGKDQGEDAHQLIQSRAYPCRRILWRAEGERSDRDGELLDFTDTSTGKRWGKMHGDRHLVTDVLKRRLDFDGLVVSDWNAYRPAARLHQLALPAGDQRRDRPRRWCPTIGRSSSPSTIGDVRAGRIPMSRIDDAVSRIIRVKLEAGLFDASPATGPHPDASALHSPAVRQLARDAVRKSLVLLKNDHRALPLRTGGKILVVGEGADSLPMQAGGWSLTWQGDKTTTSDYPYADTLLAALRKTLGSANVDYSRDGSGVDVRRYSAVVMIAAEKPYAEGAGDIAFPGLDAPQQPLSRGLASARPRQRQGCARASHCCIPAARSRRTT